SGSPGSCPPACWRTGRGGTPTSSTCARGWRRRAASSRRPSVPGPEPFQYLVLRVVPDVARGERINVGVVVFCRTLRFLEARVAVDEPRLAALCPATDVDA